MFHLGITSKDKAVDMNFAYYEEQYTYCIQTSSRKRQNHMAKGIVAFISEAYEGVSCVDGDIITLILNLSKSELSFEKNGVSAGVAFDDIVRRTDVKYKIAVAMYNKNQSVTITDYKEINESS